MVESKITSHYHIFSAPRETFYVHQMSPGDGFGGDISAPCATPDHESDWQLRCDAHHSKRRGRINQYPSRRNTGRKLFCE